MFIYNSISQGVLGGPRTSCSKKNSLDCIFSYASGRVSGRIGMKGKLVGKLCCVFFGVFFGKGYLRGKESGLESGFGFWRAEGWTELQGMWCCFIPDDPASQNRLGTQHGLLFPRSLNHSCYIVYKLISVNK